MLNEKICELREELNNSILTGQDYSITYGLSVALDELIAEYYKTELDNMSNIRKTSKKGKRRKKIICY